MTSSITPTTVGTAVSLVIQDTWTFSGGLPVFQYALKDVNGNTLSDGSVSMTSDQWNAWEAGANDAAYIASCVAANLNLSLA